MSQKKKIWSLAAQDEANIQKDVLKPPQPQRRKSVNNYFDFG
jgi:hypothetical protein